jgi:hypothetical protein
VGEIIPATIATQTGAIKLREKFERQNCMAEYYPNGTKFSSPTFRGKPAQMGPKIPKDSGRTKRLKDPNSMAERDYWIIGLLDCWTGAAGQARAGNYCPPIHSPAGPCPPSLRFGATSRTVASFSISISNVKERWPYAKLAG